MLIPAYEPDDKLVVLTEALAGDFAVLIVDDGSTGAACGAVFARAEAAGAVVLRHSVNLGKGIALKTGIAYVSKLGETCLGVVTADADGQHAPADIARVAQAMLEHPGALILGARDFSQMPARSKTGNSITRLAFRMSTGLRIKDTQTGLRGLPRALFPQLLELAGERYEYEMNMLLALPAWEAPFHEVPISTIYINKNRSSHFHALRDGYRVFSRVANYAASSLSSTALDYALFVGLTALGLGVAASFILSRAASSVLNYLLNCRTVFRTRPNAKNALAFAALVGFSMLVGAPAVALITTLGLHKLAAKFLVDTALFAFNFYMQKHVVFRVKRKSNEDRAAR